MTINPAGPARVADHARFSLPGYYHMQMTGYVMGHHMHRDPALGSGPGPDVDLILGEDFAHGAFRVESTDPEYWDEIVRWATGNAKWLRDEQAGSAA